VIEERIRVDHHVRRQVVRARSLEALLDAMGFRLSVELKATG
jgi:hypothetical protein